MKVLLLGADGQLGYALRGALAPFAYIVSASRADVDLSDFDILRRTVREARVDVVVNAAAYTAVDTAEGAEEEATRVNGAAVALLGAEALHGRFGLVHFSTDFVFDGRAGRPYRETDPVSPVNAYGRSKLAGEHALMELGAPAVVLRTSWVYGTRRRSFVSSILRAARTERALRVVADQYGSPTFCVDLAQATALILYAARRSPFDTFQATKGVYHAAGAGVASRFELARAALALDPRRTEHATETIEPVTSDEYPSAARRPLYTALDCSKLAAQFGIQLPPWQLSLERALLGGG